MDWKDRSDWEEDGALSDAGEEWGWRRVRLVGGTGWNFSFEPDSVEDANQTTKQP